MNNANDDSKKYKVSSIVLVYNGGALLRDCIESLVNQTLDDLEIILINDVSTDDSLSVCREFEKEYDNVRVIDKEINEGLARSANIGFQVARGEYVILVDNDDIIPSTAYEKLYTKAEETGADIVMGKANFLVGNYQIEIGDYERQLWEREMTVAPKDYPELFHETFYWNKLLKRDLLIDNDITLPEDVKVYADRKFSHMLMTYAEKISIIPDCVYLWRIQKDVKDKSLSMRRKEAWNYIDRIDSFESDLDVLTGFYKDYFKILMRRIIIPVFGINENKKFEEIYFDRGPKILREEFAKMDDDPFDNDLTNIDNLFVYLTYIEAKDVIKEILRLDLNKEREICNEDGKSYWMHPLFRNPEIEVPDKIFEIKYMSKYFLNIESISINESEIIFKNIEIPKHMEIKRGLVVLQGLSRPDEVLEDNMAEFEITKIDDSERNLYELTIDVDDLDNSQMYDLYFKVEYEDKRPIKFRANTYCVEEIENNAEDVKLIVTPSNNISIFNQHFDDVFEVFCDEEEIRFVINDLDKFKKYPTISLRKNSTKEMFKFSVDEDDKSFYSLKWKYFLDSKSDYAVYMTIYNDNGKMTKDIRLKGRFVSNFSEMEFLNDKKQKIKLYKTRYDNVRLRSF